MIEMIQVDRERRCFRFRARRRRFRPIRRPRETKSEAERQKKRRCEMSHVFGTRLFLIMFLLPAGAGRKRACFCYLFNVKLNG